MQWSREFQACELGVGAVSKGKQGWDRPGGAVMMIQSGWKSGEAGRRAGASKEWSMWDGAVHGKATAHLGSNAEFWSAVLCDTLGNCGWNRWYLKFNFPSLEVSLLFGSTECLLIFPLSDRGIISFCKSGKVEWQQRLTKQMPQAIAITKSVLDLRSVLWSNLWLDNLSVL